MLKDPARQRRFFTFSRGADVRRGTCCPRASRRPVHALGDAAADIGTRVRSAREDALALHGGPVGAGRKVAMKKVPPTRRAVPVQRLLGSSFALSLGADTQD